MARGEGEEDFEEEKEKRRREEKVGDSLQLFVGSRL